MLHSITALGTLCGHVRCRQWGLKIWVALVLTLGAAQISGEETEVVQRKDLQSDRRTRTAQGWVDYIVRIGMQCCERRVWHCTINKMDAVSPAILIWNKTRMIIFFIASIKLPHVVVLLSVHLSQLSIMIVGAELGANLICYDDILVFAVTFFWQASLPVGRAAALVRWGYKQSPPGTARGAAAPPAPYWSHWR